MGTTKVLKNGWRTGRGKVTVFPLHLPILASTNIPSFPSGLLSRVYSDGHLSVCLDTTLGCDSSAHRQGLVPGNSVRLALYFPPPSSPGSLLQVSLVPDSPNSMIPLPRTGMGTVSQEATRTTSVFMLSLHPSFASVKKPLDESENGE